MIGVLRQSKRLEKENFIEKKATEKIKIQDRKENRQKSEITTAQVQVRGSFEF